MIPTLNELIEDSRINSGSSHPLSRMDVIHSIIKTPITSELRFQGVNMAGADLNRLDLRYINFKVILMNRLFEIVSYKSKLINVFPCDLQIFFWIFMTSIFFGNIEKTTF